ncbi:MAG: hypothetical protein HFG20_11735 [Anaerotruncus sp.]|nr:hypothetical protein [Anaerotruncus sp.]
MPCIHQFGVIEQLDPNKNYEVYEPELYQLVAVQDDYLDAWWQQLMLMKSYFHRLDRPAYGLARYGITLLPPESLPVFYDAVAAGPYRDAQVNQLLALLLDAIQRKKFVIHYGV